MRVKTFYGLSEKKMDQRINDFISDNYIEVVDIKFSTAMYFFSAMVIYKEK